MKDMGRMAGNFLSEFLFILCLTLAFTALLWKGEVSAVLQASSTRQNLSTVLYFGLSLLSVLLFGAKQLFDEALEGFAQCLETAAP